MRLKAYWFEPLAQRPCLLHAFFAQGCLNLADKGFPRDGDDGAVTNEIDDSGAHRTGLHPDLSFCSRRREWLTLQEHAEAQLTAGTIAADGGEQHESAFNLRRDAFARPGREDPQLNFVRSSDALAPQ